MTASLECQVQELLNIHKGLKQVERFDGKITLIGSINFKADFLNKNEIEDSYLLKVSISKFFPNIVPIVYELNERIPKEFDRHIKNNESICLGSPLRLRLEVFNNPTLIGFIESCVIPFLYANSFYEIHIKYPWGDLGHSFIDVIPDYLDIFNLSNKAQLYQALLILKSPKFKARKLTCPCGCKKRYLMCSYSKHLELINKLGIRKFFADSLREFKKKTKRKKL